jgi:hypothetical protein
MNKQAMDDEIFSAALHENCIFNIDCLVSIHLNPYLNVLIPPSSNLLGAINVLEKLENTTCII